MDLSDNELYNDFHRMYSAFGPFVIEPRDFCGHDVTNALERLALAGLVSFTMKMRWGQVRAKITVHERPVRTIEELYPEFGVNNGRRFRESW